jgi:hypothetical protein
VVCQLAPAAEAYWTVQPSTLTEAGPALNSSTKSFVKLAPAFPPPA